MSESGTVTQNDHQVAANHSKYRAQSKLDYSLKINKVEEKKAG